MSQKERIWSAAGGRGGRRYRYKEEEGQILGDIFNYEVEGKTLANFGDLQVPGGGD